MLNNYCVSVCSCAFTGLTTYPSGKQALDRFNSIFSDLSYLNWKIKSYNNEITTCNLTRSEAIKLAKKLEKYPYDKSEPSRMLDSGDQYVYVWQSVPVATPTCWI